MSEENATTLAEAYKSAHEIVNQYMNRPDILIEIVKNLIMKAEEK